MIQNNNDAMDLLKFAMSIIIVAIHCELFLGSWWLLLLWPWARICVPMFFMISAYFFFKKHPTGDGILGFVLRIGKIYIFWFIVFLPITLYYRGHYWWHADGVMNCLIRFTRSFLLGGTFGASWYLMALVIGMTFLVLLEKYIGELGTWGVSIFAFLACCTTSNYWTLLPADSSLVHSLAALNAYWPKIHNSFPVALLWVCIGRFMALHNNEIKLPRKVLVPLIVLFAAVLWLEWVIIWYFTNGCHRDCYLMLPPICFALFVLINGLRLRVPIALELRRASIVIFLSHLIILSPIQDLIRNGSRGALFTIVLSTSLGIYVLLRLLSAKWKMFQWAW